MKKSIRLLFLLFAMGAASFVLQGCLKDTVESTLTYTIYTPVYKTMREARNDIMTSSPIQIQYPSKIYLKDNYIFVSEAYKGIHIIDNTNPASPQNIGYIDIPNNKDMAIKNNILYADMYSDLLAIDISNPKNAKLKKVTENVFTDYPNYNAETKIIASYKVRDTVIFSKKPVVPRNGEIWYYYDGLKVFSSGTAFNNGATAGAGPAYGTGGSMARFAATKERLFTVGSNNLAVFNITDAVNPSFIVRKNLGWGIETIFPFKDNLFVGSTTGVIIFSLDNPDNPLQVGTFGHVQKCDPVVANDKYAFVTLRAGSSCFTTSTTSELQILSIQSLTSPTLIKSYTVDNPYGLSIDGNTLFLCDGTSGLKVYDASDVANIKLIRQIKDIKPYDVIAMNGLAIVVGEKGIYQYDYKNLNNIKLLSTTELKK